MELDDLKKDWQNTANVLTSDADFIKMTKMNNHPSIKKIRKKFLIESVALTAFLIVYYTGLDGDEKPFFSNVLLIISILLYILNNLVGYISVRNPIRSTNIKSSIGLYLAYIKRLSVLSLTVSIIYAVALLSFFSSVIQFTGIKLVWLALLISIFLGSIYLSKRIWTNWIGKLQQQADELNHDMD